MFVCVARLLKAALSAVALSRHSSGMPAVGLAVALSGGRSGTVKVGLCLRSLWRLFGEVGLCLVVAQGCLLFPSGGRLRLLWRLLVRRSLCGCLAVWCRLVSGYLCLVSVSFS
jgi:hypothetical protein